MNQKLKVKGVAVKTGTSKNGITYTDENLQATAHELADKPILKDHEALTDNVIGRTESSSFAEGKVFFEGWVKDDPTNEKLLDGRIKEVSIGAMVERLVKESEDSDNVIAEGIHYMELSVTPTPAVNGTSISHSEVLTAEILQNIQSIKEATSSPSNNKTEEHMEEIKTIPAMEYEKLQKELESLKLSRKRELVSEVMKLAKGTTEESLMNKSDEALKLMLEYERKLQLQEVVAQPRAEVVHEARRAMVSEVVKARDSRTIEAAARIPGTIIAEIGQNGKLEIWKALDYSKMGWRMK